jgi:hypothetical protein
MHRSILWCDSSTLDLTRMKIRIAKRDLHPSTTTVGYMQHNELGQREEGQSYAMMWRID